LGETLAPIQWVVSKELALTAAAPIGADSSDVLVVRSVAA
jgi:hypothetical protein